jgi:membrane protease YdiL (CAAX protease family)
VDRFILYELAYVIYFVGWEFIYRGFMLFGLARPLGYYAVFIQTIPFALLHFGKPQVETLSAVLAGILLGYLALRTRSFWYGWLLHILVATSNDVLAIMHQNGILE